MRASISAMLCASVIVTLSSAAACTSSEGVNLNNDRSDSLATLFSPDERTKSIHVPRGMMAAELCIQESNYTQYYPAKGIYSVTGSVPFSVPKVNGKNCHVVIRSAPEDGMPIFISKPAACEVWLSKRGAINIIVRNNVDLTDNTSGQNFRAAECFYRTALFLEGYPGAYKANIFGAYPGNFYFAGKRSYVGPIVAPEIQKILRRCPEIRGLYYSSDLTSYYVKTCKNIIKGFE